MRVKEESEKSGTETQHSKTKMMTSGPITSWQIEGGKVEATTDFFPLGSEITVDGDCSHQYLFLTVLIFLSSLEFLVSVSIEFLFLSYLAPCLQNCKFSVAFKHFKVPQAGLFFSCGFQTASIPHCLSHKYSIRQDRNQSQRQPQTSKITKWKS